MRHIRVASMRTAPMDNSKWMKLNLTRGIEPAPTAAAKAAA